MFTRSWRMLIAGFVLAASAGYADDAQLQFTRERLHEAATKLDNMTDEQWMNLQVNTYHRDPAKVIPLALARQQAHERADSFDTMNSTQFNNQMNTGVANAMQNTAKTLQKNGGTLTPDQMHSIAAPQQP